SGFRPGDKTTILQIVSNPSWLMPYFACAIGALGLVIHFGINLIGFVRKNLKRKSERPAFAKPQAEECACPGWLSFGTVLSLLFVVAMYAMALGSVLQPVGTATKFDLATFGTLPISYEGRVQPLDSLARNSLKIVSSRETATLDGEGQISAIRWLADVFGRPDKASDYPVIR